MHKQFTFICTIFSVLLWATSTQAEIYKNVDADGHVTYSNVKSKGAKKLDIEPADTSFGEGSTPTKKHTQASKTPTPESFPKVDADTQKQRDGSRKQILLSELDAEKAALAAAESSYAEADAKPEMARGKDGKYFKNMGRHEEKLAPLRAEVEAHRRNIALLEKEISATN